MTACIVALIGMAAGPAWAGCGTYACDNVTLKTIHVQAGDNIYIEIHQDTASLNCTRVDGRYLTLQASDTNADKIYAMLLSAQAAGKAVGRLRIVEGSGNCALAYA